MDTELEGRVKELEREVTELRLVKRRYEYVRRMRPEQFQALFRRCIVEDRKFDPEVDAMVLIDEIRG